MNKNPRIFVLADDLSGAAEIGGKAFNFGLSVRLLTEGNRLKEYSDDVVIVDARLGLLWRSRTRAGAGASV